MQWLLYNYVFVCIGTNVWMGEHGMCISTGKTKSKSSAAYTSHYN